ncbi:HEAT repeat domain-containing protein [Phormidium sp. LEGE 05292]|nr:HEAT repeat domain-containing protein [Phormidium sp. LEGE 05292]
MTNHQQLIQAVEKADSPDRLIAAVRSLAAARHEAGIPTLIAALGYNNPAVAVTAMEGLIQMGEAAVPLLLELLDGYNYGARAYAIRALATIAEPRALDVLLTAAENDFAPSVRRAASKGLGNLHWERLEKSQIRPAQEQAFLTLVKVSQDSDWSIRYAAIVGLQALATQSHFQAKILDLFQQIGTKETDSAVRARVQLAINQF